MPPASVKTSPVWPTLLPLPPTTMSLLCSTAPPPPHRFFRISFTISQVSELGLYRSTDISSTWQVILPS